MDMSGLSWVEFLQGQLQKSERAGRGLKGVKTVGPHQLSAVEDYR
jgi:hypothetical protein